MTSTQMDNSRARCASPRRNDHGADYCEQPAKSGDGDDFACARIMSSVADQALLHVAGVNPLDVVVADGYDLAHVDFIDPKAVISGIDDPAMVVPSVAQAHRHIPARSHKLQLVSDFQRMRVWACSVWRRR